ncbi:MAG: hypothetical protein Q8R79_01360 [Legionellaceae bacterium]|nr:hypothetical protein [Legionellaceae bacterium]
MKKRLTQVPGSTPSNAAVSIAPFLSKKELERIVQSCNIFTHPGRIVYFQRDASATLRESSLLGTTGDTLSSLLTTLDLGYPYSENLTSWQANGHLKSLTAFQFTVSLSNPSLLSGMAHIIIHPQDYNLRDELAYTENTLNTTLFLGRKIRSAGHPWRPHQDYMEIEYTPSHFTITASAVTKNTSLVTGQIGSFGEYSKNLYSGEIYEGKYHGLGTLLIIESDPEISFQRSLLHNGMFKNGTFDGKGSCEIIQSTNDGRSREITRYEGSWKNNLPHGEHSSWCIEQASDQALIKPTPENYDVTRSGMFNEGVEIGVHRKHYRDGRVVYSQTILSIYPLIFKLFFDKNKRISCSVYSEITENDEQQRVLFTDALSVFLQLLFQNGLYEFIALFCQNVSFRHLKVLGAFLANQNSLWAPSIFWSEKLDLLAQLAYPESAYFQAMNTADLYPLLSNVQQDLQQFPSNRLLAELTGIIQLLQPNLTAQKAEEISSLFPKYPFNPNHKLKKLAPLVADYTAQIKTHYLPQLVRCIYETYSLRMQAPEPTPLVHTIWQQLSELQTNIDHFLTTSAPPELAHSSAFFKPADAFNQTSIVQGRPPITQWISDLPPILNTNLTICPSSRKNFILMYQGKVLECLQENGIKLYPSELALKKEAQKLEKVYADFYYFYNDELGHQCQINPGSLALSAWTYAGALLSQLQLPHTLARNPDGSIQLPLLDEKWSPPSSIEPLPEGVKLRL